MISDQSDEDADTLDDDKLLATYLGVDPQKPPQSPVATSEPLDWPPTTQHDIRLAVDSTTLAWFKAHHADWQHQMRFVLRAWVIAQAAPSGTLNESGERAGHDSLNLER